LLLSENVWRGRPRSDLPKQPPASGHRCELQQAKTKKVSHKQERIGLSAKTGAKIKLRMTKGDKDNYRSKQQR
jgi:hypothetical protein